MCIRQASLCFASAGETLSHLMRTAARLAVVLREPEGHLSLTEIELSGQDLVSTSRQLVDSRLAKYRSLKSWSLIGSTAIATLNGTRMDAAMDDQGDVAAPCSRCPRLSAQWCAYACPVLCCRCLSPVRMCVQTHD